MNFLRFKGHIWIALAVGMSSLIGAANASALSASAKPSRPKVELIRSTAKSSKGSVNVTVSFSIAGTKANSPILQTQVKVGTKTCTANRMVTKCTVKAVAAGKTYKVLVRAKNRNGYSAWSSSISFVANSRSSWMRAVATTPSSTTGTPSNTSTLPPGAAKGLFEVGDAVGLFVTSANSVSLFGVRAASTELVLKKITSSGAIQNVATDSSVTMRNFYIAPNNKIYALDVNWRDLKTGNPKSCFILEVNTDSGDPICVLQSRNEAPGMLWGRDSLLNASSALQFDRNGAVYFMFSTQAPGGNVYFYGSSTSQFVRRYLNGVSTDFGIGYIADGQPDCYGNTSAYEWRDTISSFHVMDDGTLLVDQSHQPRVWQCDPNRPYEGRPITRTTDIYGPDGSFRSVERQSNNQIGFFLSKDSGAVLANYDIINVKTGQITGSYFGSESISPSFTRQSVGCSTGHISFDGPDGYFQEMVCFYGAIDWEKSFLLLDGSRFAQIRKGAKAPEGMMGRDEFAILLQITPQMRKVVSQVKKVIDALPMLGHILITGVDDSGLFSTVLYDPSNSTERILLGTDLNIRVNKLSFNSNLNTIFATGERQSNGEKVLVVIKMTGEIEVQIQKFEGEILNLQSFGS